MAKAKPRYAIFDTDSNQYLMRVEMLTVDGKVTYTLWTKNPAEAQRFPGIKSAFALMMRIGTRTNLIIRNGRGMRVG